jgi:hypothetical protein
MTFEIYHQLGHRDKWSIDSYQQDGTGDGVIISPRSRKKANVESLSQSVKSRAIFDPQFFNPNAVIKKMDSYDFYPDTLMPGGFDTGRFPNYCSIVADNCVDFQIKNNFRYLVIPTRYFDGAPDVEQFVQNQETNFVTPFLDSRDHHTPKKDAILQLVLTGHMLRNKPFIEYLLTWITGIEGIKGIYLITEIVPRGPQITDATILLNLMNFIHILHKNKMIVVLGYLNSESLLFSLANPSIVTIGSFGNLRIFNSTMFEETDPGEIRVPTYKIYSPVLLDWIDAPYVDLMKNRSLVHDKFFGDNKYLDTMFSQGYNGSAQSIEPYKHYFVEISKQLQEIRSLTGANRYARVIEIIQTAIDEYSRINESGIEIGRQGAFTTQFATAANLFARDQGWRT